MAGLSTTFMILSFLIIIVFFTKLDGMTNFMEPVFTIKPMKDAIERGTDIVKILPRFLNVSTDILPLIFSRLALTASIPTPLPDICVVSSDVLKPLVNMKLKRK